MIAGQLSDAGVSVLAADVKGDLSGLAQPIDGGDPKIAELATSLGWTVEPRAHPVALLLMAKAGLERDLSGFVLDCTACGQEIHWIQGISTSDSGHWAHRFPAPHGEPVVYD